MKKLKPPVFAVITFAAMLAVHRWVPIKQIIPVPWNLLGSIPLLFGAAISLHALWLFRHYRTTPEPFGTPRLLVTNGPSRFSRNPMHAGILLIFSGVACLLGTATPWLAIPVLGVVFDRLFIRAEEKKLAMKFGDTYRRYHSRVRRWL